MSCIDVAKVTGQHILFVGVGSQIWTAAQFRQCAQFSRAHGIDALLIKAADGANWWYNGIAGYRAFRDVIKAEGVGVIPYIYSYGNKFGALDAEIAILQTFMAEDGVVCMNAEAEWNGQVAWAQHLCSKMQGSKGVFLVSTWADPALQNWQGVLSALNPCVDAYMPEQYDNYLASCWQQFAGAACLQPTLEMTQDVGPNNIVAIAKAAHDQGHTAISIWHYGTAIQNPGLLDQVLAAFPKTINPPQEEPMTIDLTNGTVASHFSGDNNIWKCKDNGFLVGYGILGFYRKFGGDALCGLTYLGLPQGNETPVPGHAGVVYQRFERAVLAYDPQHIIDTPPGSGDVYCMHITSGLGQDPQIAALQKQIAAMQPAALVAENAKLKAEIAAAQKDLSS